LEEGAALLENSVRRRLSLVALVAGVGLIYLFAARDGSTDLLAQITRPFLTASPLHHTLWIFSLVFLYLSISFGLLGSDRPRSRDPAGWFCLALSLVAPLSWLWLVHGWSTGYAPEWLFALFLLGAGEALAGTVILIWAWCRPRPDVRLLAPACLSQAMGLGLFSALALLTLGG